MNLYVRVVLSLCIVVPAVSVSADNAGSPMVCLYDAGSSSATAISADSIDGKAGWTAIAEDALAHNFKGDAVFLNNGIALVLRSKARGAELYSRNAKGFACRATITPADPRAAEAQLSSVKILENSSAAVMLEASFKSAGGECMARFRMTAGEILLEVRGTGRDGKLRIRDRAQYVVVPDFFADDLIYDPAAIKARRVGLPTENSLLGLLDSGNAVLATVWQSPQQGAEVLFSEQAGQRAVDHYQIDLPKDKSIWLAVLDGPNVWSAAQSLDKAARDWKPPFPAKWRINVVAPDGTCTSHTTSDAAPYATPTPANARLAMTYPIDRTRATPLDSFCFIDVLRNSLGVGPCQYILDCEGLSLKDNPTPDQVVSWIEKQFEKKKSRREPDLIREQLKNMAQQVRATEQRLSAYRDLSRQLRQICGEAQGDALVPLNPALVIVDSIAAPSPATQPAAESIDDLSRQISELADRDDAAATFQPLAARLRAVGADQNYRLAKARMALRRLTQECRTLIAANSPAAPFASRLQQQAGQTLHRK